MNRKERNEFLTVILTYAASEMTADTVRDWMAEQPPEIRYNLRVREMIDVFEKGLAERLGGTQYQAAIAQSLPGWPLWWTRFVPMQFLKDVAKERLRKKIEPVIRRMLDDLVKEIFSS